MNKVIVNDNPAFAEYAIKIGLAEHGTPYIAHALPADINGKDVIGVLPLHLACLASSVTVIPIIPPKHLRGEDLYLEDIEMYAKRPEKFEVRRIK